MLAFSLSSFINFREFGTYSLLYCQRSRYYLPLAYNSPSSRLHNRCAKMKRNLKSKRQAAQFYALLKSIMDELLNYTKSRHIKIPDASFGLIYDQRDSILFSGIDSKTGKKIFLYNVRLIGKSFEKRKEQMLLDKTPETFLNWIADLCSTYISSLVYDYVVKEQHRGEGTSDRTVRQIVRGFMNKLMNDPELKHVLDIIRTKPVDS